jgi:Tfp pilus assembly protein PilO
VDSGERGAAVAARSLTEATADLQDAQATRDGQAQATSDLDKFYREVLPSDLATARRITHLKLSQMAREHDVAFERSRSTPEALKNSDLEHLQVSYELSGNWDAIRQFIYRVETGREFVVIDNVVLAEGTDSSAPLSLRLDLSTYYRVGGHDR